MLSILFQRPLWANSRSVMASLPVSNASAEAPPCRRRCRLLGGTCLLKHTDGAHDPLGGAPGGATVRGWGEETGVTFAPLSVASIEAYVDSGEPMDKAGGYGIQAAGGQFVSGIT